MAILHGSTEPRLYTQPLRRLTRKTSLGFEIIDWAEKELHWKPLPWQRWLIIHANEKLPNGKLRFRKILFLAARQNGKSNLVSVLATYWMTHGNPKVLYSSASLDTAKDQWEIVSDYCEDNPSVFGPARLRKMNGHWSTELSRYRATYTVISANRRGGRGKFAINRALVDELREHSDFDAMAAVESTMLTVDDSQIWMLSNAGDNRAVVLNHWRAVGQSGEDPELGYFEWSAPDDCEIDDTEAWAAANPGLGFTITERALRSLMNGPATIFRTENLCRGVPNIAECISAGSWQGCYDPGTLDNYRSNVFLCLDSSPDLRSHVLVAAAVLTDGRVRVETVAAWDSTSEVRHELPELVKRINPRAIGWYPASNGALSTDLKNLSKHTELTGADTTAACQQLADAVAAGRLAHSGDELLTSHILNARKLRQGDGWRFDRQAQAWVNGAYAIAGAVYLARKEPEQKIYLF